MLIQKLYVIKDNKVEAFTKPFFERNADTGIRIVDRLVVEPDTEYSMFPEDFSLFEIGVLNLVDGSFVAHAAPVHVINFWERGPKAKIAELKEAKQG